MEKYCADAFSMKDQVVIITGGASGLGFAMAKCMKAAGAKVIILGSRDEKELKSACDEIGGGAAYYRFDITQTSEIQALVDNIIKEHKKVDVLVNNAGVHCKKPVEQMTMEDFSRVLDVHLFGSYAFCKAVIPHMRSRKSGCILFVSSMSALFGLTSVSAYSAAKSAVLGLTRSLASEVSSDNVRVNAIVPGFIDSPMFRKAVEGDVNRQQKILGRTPMNSYGNPEDIGWAGVYLCSKAASFVTGTSLVVDGGCSIGF